MLLQQAPPATELLLLQVVAGVNVGRNVDRTP